MKLPFFESAVLKPDKITAYLLSENHSSGRHKAKFFTSFGFTPEDWQQLSIALVKHAEAHSVTNEEPSEFGTRYAIEGKIETPDRRNPNIRSIWFIEKNSTIPYFVTAYPLEGK